MKRVLVVVVWASAVGNLGTAWAQKADSLRSSSDDFDKIIEDSIAEEEESQLPDVLDRLAERTLDINAASETQLQQIPGIDASLARRIVQARKRKLFRNFKDLSAIEGVSDGLLERMRPFVIVGPDTPREDHPSLSIHHRMRVRQDVQRRRGYIDGVYHGSPAKFYSRFLAEWTDAAGRGVLRDGEIGVVAEKDPGEREVDGFLSAFLRTRLTLVPAEIIVGDFVVEMGQGLVLWSGTRVSKGSDVVVPAGRSGLGIRPYVSTDEMSFLRGAALTVELGWITPSFFYSNKSISGSLNGEGEITSLYAGGLFRTESELRRRNVSRERLVGVTIQGEPTEGLRFEVGGFRSRYLHPVIVEASEGGKQDRGVAGASVTWSRSGFAVFAEAAFQNAKPGAMVFGAILRPLRDLSLVFAGRRYHTQFENEHASGFRESGNSRNEHGFYAGMNASLTPWLSLSGYFDQFRFPGKSSLSRFSSSGNESFVQSKLKIGRNIGITLQYREKKKTAPVDIKDLFARSGSISGGRLQKNYRSTLEFMPSGNLRWRTRVEVVDVSLVPSQTRERGMLVFQDLGVEILRGVHVAARAAIFDTPSFDSRVYEFESDVRGSFSNVAVFGKGLRMYLLARVAVSVGVSVGIKYEVTAKEEVRKIGTGLDELDGDQEGRVTIQCDLSF